MSDARLVHRQELVVGLDYGQFYLHAAGVDPEMVPEVLERALDGEGIAQSGGVLVVESPHQNNFAMPVTVEVWDGRPAEDVAQWQEAFEAHLDVGADGLVYESPTVEVTEIDVAPGSYHALITGRGFVSHGWPGSTEPGDEWRLRLWPSPGPEAPRRLQAFSEPAVEMPGGGSESPGRWGDPDAQLQRRERAHQAGLRIMADLDRAPTARSLSGELGYMVIDTAVPGKRARYWFLAANLDVTDGSSRPDPEIGDWFLMTPGSGDNDEDIRDPITGTNGEIYCEWSELDPPRTVAMTWQWLGPEGWVLLSDKELYELPTESHPRQVPRLDKTSVLRLELADDTDGGDTPMTRVHLVHADVPVEWISDLTDFWNSKIDMWVGQAHLPNGEWRSHGL